MTTSPTSTSFPNNVIVCETVSEHAVVQNNITNPAKPPPLLRIQFTNSHECDSSSILSDRLFPLILVATVTLCIGGGFFARRISPVQQTIIRSVRKIKTEFRLTEEVRVVKPQKPIVKKPKIIKQEKVIDLTKKPVEQKKSTSRYPERAATDSKEKGTKSIRPSPCLFYRIGKRWDDVKCRCWKNRQYD